MYKGTILALLLALPACTAEHRAALKYGEEQVETYESTKARLLLKAPCGMTAGAYWRALTNEERRAVDTLCER